MRLTRAIKATPLAAILLPAALALSACGSEQAAKAPAGSVSNPLVSGADPNNGVQPDAPGQVSVKPNYKALVTKQSNSNRTAAAADSPCGLVTKHQAQLAIRTRLIDPMEAPQGPTCIFRDRAGKTFVTLAVQPTPFAQIRKQIHRIHKVSVASRPAYCGVQGAPVLVVPLAHGRTLSVSAQCKIAMGLARFAVPRLSR
jgi:hypothetical protein